MNEPCSTCGEAITLSDERVVVAPHDGVRFRYYHQRCALPDPDERKAI